MSHTSESGLLVTRYRRVTGSDPDLLVASMEFDAALSVENLFGLTLHGGRLWDLPYVVASNPPGDWIEARSEHEITDQGDTEIVCYRRMRVPGPTD